MHWNPSIQDPLKYGHLKHFLLTQMLCLCTLLAQVSRLESTATYMYRGHIEVHIGNDVLVA